MKIILVAILLIIGIAFAVRDYQDGHLCDAIFAAEGGLKAKYLYGITSVPYSNIKDARQICMNTIRNQRTRHRKHKCGLTYIECLAKRYCPYD